VSFIFKTPKELLKEIAKKAKNKRLSLNFSQEGLAKRAGLSLSSLKRFEKTGQIAFTSLLNIALVLNSLEDFEKLFEENINEKKLSLDEILKEKPERKRGRKK
jgi:transcriptional regulator with XRE-family HTH domain